MYTNKTYIRVFSDCGAQPQVNSSTWKFWRKLSSRRNDHKSRHRREIISFEWSNGHAREQDKEGDCLSPLRGTLPDVLDATCVHRSNSLRPPEKPPRLFLFRSSSINNPRSSVDGGSARNSVVMSQPQSIVINGTDTNGVSRSKKEPLPLVAKGVQSERENRKNNSEKDSCKNHSKENGFSNKTQDISVFSSQDSCAKIKNSSPSLTPPKPVRLRRKSSDRNDCSRQKIIMASVADLLCQRLDPTPLLDKLHDSGVIGDNDFLAFTGHPDKTLVSENLVNSLANGGFSQFSDFCDVLSSSEDNRSVSNVLQVIKRIDYLIHDIPCAKDELSQVMADDKKVSYDVGYLNHDTGCLRPLVELERVTKENGLNKRCSKVSGLSWESDTSVSNGGHDDCTPVVNISITGHSLSGQRAAALSEVIKNYDCIVELQLGKTQLTGEDIAVIADAVSVNNSITYLDFRLNTLNYSSAEAISRMLKENTCLRRLNLSSCGTDLSSCLAVVGAVTLNRTLFDLDLSFLDMGDEGCVFLRDMIKCNTVLQKLRLRGNNITCKGCYRLAEGLSRNKSLLELDVSRNVIGDVGVEALTRYIPDTTLTTLSFENCGITSTGCDSVAELLATNKKLRHLDLSVNALGDVGIYKLTTSLERTSTLKTIGLNMCRITNDGFSKLLDAMEKNTSIHLLKLCYNRLGKEHANPAATSDNLKYRLRIVTSSKPKLKILLWGNSFEES